MTLIYSCIPFKAHWFRCTVCTWGQDISLEDMNGTKDTTSISISPCTVCGTFLNTYTPWSVTHIVAVKTFWPNHTTVCCISSPFLSHPTFLFALYTFTIGLGRFHKTSCHAPRWASCSYKSRPIIGLFRCRCRRWVFFSFFFPSSYFYSHQIDQQPLWQGRQSLREDGGGDSGSGRAVYRALLWPL